MATHRTGKSAIVLSSVLLQMLFYLTAVYFTFYFLSTLCIIIYKSRVLSYPDKPLVQDVGLLFFMAGLELLRLYSGMKGNLQEKEGYLWASLGVTGMTALSSVYYLVWQTYVMRADVILNSVLLSVYGLGGVLGLTTLARFTRRLRPLPRPRLSYLTESFTCLQNVPRISSMRFYFSCRDNAYHCHLRDYFNFRLYRTKRKAKRQQQKRIESWFSTRWMS
ncbi:hypothetical protein DPEC_G00159330 [Dallia pectoralis]|uniref:Uncharacterized protein n=1 Tax=Dallia pectoralis TaxID=75939 RepID=A0ACC2GFV5_DALPE|nr:hypothetical protein DPEC_G00159330 [Dallia pectoralis]